MAPPRRVMEMGDFGGSLMARGIVYMVATPLVVIAPICPLLLAQNQRRLSGPAAIPTRPCAPPPIGYSVTTPLVVIFPTRLAPVSVNQIFPSGPAAIPCGELPADTGNSLISSPRNVAAEPGSMGELTSNTSRGG